MSVPTRTRRSARSSLRLALLVALCVGGGALAADEDGPGTEAAAMEELPDPIIDPDRAEGWAVDGPPRIYLRDTLSDFINGGAALYLGYSFRWVAVWVVRSSGFDLEATIELYRFSEPSDALGVYLNGARGPGEGLPFERSQVRRGLLRAQRGPYFVRVLCRDQGVRADDAARSLGGVLGLALPEATTDLPDLLLALPEEDRRPDSLRYFHTKEAFDAQYYLGDANLLDLDKDTECGWALYAPASEGASPTKLCLVRYPDRERAEGAVADFAGDYLESDAPAPGGLALRIIEDGTWAGAILHPEIPCLALVLDADSAERARELCHRALEGLDEEMSR